MPASDGIEVWPCVLKFATDVPPYFTSKQYSYKSQIKVQLLMKVSCIFLS